MKVSNCCGFSGHGICSETVHDYEQAEICTRCGEHCEYIEETDLNTINTENEQRISKTGLPTGTSGTDKKNLSSRGNG